MPYLADRVQETTTTGGTGTLTLGGAVTGYRTFAASFTVGDALYYTIDNGSGEWEIGQGTLVTSGTLSRDTVIESSNSNALVNFSSGTKRVFCSAPTRVLLPNQTGNSGKVLSTDGTSPSWTTTLNGFTIGNVTAGSGAFTTLSASSTVSGSGFSTYLASPPAIGGTTPAAGSFTTLSTTGNVTLGDASADTVTLNANTVTLNNSTTISAASTKTLTLNGGAGSNGLVLDASNNVGIGTSSPGAKFNVVANGKIAQFTPSTTGTAGYLAFSSDSGFTTARSILGVDNSSGNGLWSVGGSAYALNIGTVDSYPIIFGTNNTERMRLDASGNLGLGVTPSAWGSSYSVIQIGASASIWSPKANSSQLLLNANSYYDGTSYRYISSNFASDYYQVNGYHIWRTAPSGTAGSAISGANAFVQAMTLDASGRLGLGITSPTNYGANTVTLSINGASGGYLDFYYNGSRRGLLGGDATAGLVIDTSDAGSSTGPLIFKTLSAERARIDSSGNLLVGTTSLNGGISAITNNLSTMTTRNTGATAGKFWKAPYVDINNSCYIINNNNTGVYVADGATSWTANSDERLKTDLKPIENAAEKVATLRAVTGRFKTDEEGMSRSFLIAQDVQKVLPEAVSVEDDELGTLGVRYTETIPLLVAAIQELSAELNELKAKVNA